MAVVTQPFDRGAKCSAPGKPDEELGEFWEDDPWEIAFKHNLSAYERNRVYLNLNGRAFVDVSEVSTADVDGDSRSAVALDYDADGDMDVLLRQAGGAPLVLFRNEFPAGNYLKVSLRGVQNNSFGIGAKITAVVGSRRIVRELFPVNSFHSQAPACVHFGVGDAQVVDELQLRWPDGREQVIRDVPANQHILVRENHPTVERVMAGQPIPES